MTAEGIEVFEVQSKKDLNDFIKLPYSLYSKDPFFVPPLIKEMKSQFSIENPFFEHAIVKYFIARKDKDIVGRITSIINKRHNEFHNENAGFFGFFESVNDLDVASALLDKVSDNLRREGMDILRGPMNFSTNEECGFLFEGFNTYPMLMTPYNPAYYNELMERYGMTKSKDLYAYIYNVAEELPEKVDRVAHIAEKSGIRVRPLNKKVFDYEMNIFKDVYNSAWEKNWGFIPLTDKELSYLSKRLKTIAVPELTLIAEKDNEHVGFMGLLPDFNFILKHMKGKINPVSIAKALYYSKKIQDLRLLLLGIKPKYRNRGVDALLFREGFKGVKKGGYKRVELSWILEDNIPTQRLVEMLGSKLYKKYRIYEKNL
jgi:GNAT superfamily N-acetyltransferase